MGHIIGKSNSNDNITKKLNIMLEENRHKTSEQEHKMPVQRKKNK